MNTELFSYRILEDNENIYEVENLPEGAYDPQAATYDRLISNGLYNRIMWGNSPEDYAAFCREGLQRSGDGPIADIGCGTLSFTSGAYAGHSGKELFLCDLSREMLKIGKTRIERQNGNMSDITLLRSDALAMPFKDNTLGTILSFGILHIFPEPEALIREFVRILKPGGQIFLTSLCTDRLLSARYLKLLYKKGHVARPLSSTEITGLLKASGIKINAFGVKGGMAYASGVK